jgi:formate-dependent nitrite reductase membrane component NrfD
LFLSVLGAVSFLHLVLWIWPTNVLAGAPGLRNILSLIGIIFGFAAVIYTGFLLNASRPIAFWSTGALPALFLVSAFASGLLAIVLVSALRGGVPPGTMQTMGYITIASIILEMFVLIFHLQATHRVPEGQAAASILLKESGSFLFWYGVAGLGILIPLLMLILSLFVLKSMNPGVLNAMVIVAAAAGLLGNLFLREAVLAGGVFAPLKAGRFEYMITNP